MNETSNAQLRVPKGSTKDGLIQACLSMSRVRMRGRGLMGLQVSRGGSQQASHGQCICLPRTGFLSSGGGSRCRLK